MVSVHNTQQTNSSRAAEVDYSSAFVEQRVVASTMPAPCQTDVSHRRASDEGAAIHRRERHHPSPEDEIGGRARLRWLWEAHWGGKSVIIWRLFSARVDDAQRLCIANK